jgi:thioredoxin-like negative regulator of GroEL
MSTISSFYRRSEVWLILFYKSNDRDSKQYKDVWREIAEKLYGIIRVAAVNCIADAEEALCEDFTVYDVPKVQVFPANSRLEPLNYEGPIDYNSIAGFAVQQMESFVKIVTDNNYEEFVHEDFDKTKVLLFTAKKSTPPLLRALSKDFKGRVVFGEVRQSNQKLIQKFQINNFPTLLVLSDALNHQGVAYQAEFKKDQMAKFLREHSGPTQRKATRNVGGVFKELTPGILSAGPCSNTDGNLCLLAILGRQNSQDNENLKNILHDLAPNFADDPIQFFHISSGNILYSKSFPNSGKFPALYIIKGKRERFVKYEGTFTSGDVKNFVETVISGSAQFSKMTSALEIGRNSIDQDL